uniref:Pentacotripeptide-repeat region of PRORP domain-containing protein n=1 Tax=Oryza punctata TaxID=4537 RepID=A0A0E0M6Z9_ORYPU
MAEHHLPRLPASAAGVTSWTELLAPFDLSRLSATLASALSPRAASAASSCSRSPCHLPPPPHLLKILGPPLLLTSADPDRTLSLLDSLPSGFLPLYESLLLSLLRSLPPGHALHLLDQLPRRFGVQPSFHSYNVVLSVLARADCHADALVLYGRMVHRDRVPPTTFTFGVTARALYRLSRADEALALLRGMARHGCIPDTVLYQTVIHALCDQGGVAKATTRLNEMLFMGCTADVNTFDDVVRGMCGLGRVREEMSQSEGCEGAVVDEAVRRVVVVDTRGQLGMYARNDVANTVRLGDAAAMLEVDDQCG